MCPGVKKNSNRVMWHIKLTGMTNRTDLKVFCLLPVGVCIDAYVTICSYVLCVHSLVTRLQLKKMTVMYESAHDAITFVINT